MNREEIIARLRENEAALRKLGVAHAALFGSRARGDQRPESDTDIMIEFDHDVGVAFRPLIAPRPRAEQCGMSYAQLAQRGFVLPQPGYDLFAIHNLPLA